ncbi:hypothetical protein [Qipengyuania qiaonensis]|uniref:Uncharacterized protein n=1 Tax=Qipengyuania qiaonensis TaxID=2867240 RepID=A0ABS7JDV4_9SPHN|nr:hypothetical protein [Qipengyuania qiaonensis]MBX7483868.1 hypothetical protein [Qipengyuania qiaonensis]
MFALVLIALVIAVMVAATGTLADSGLRWWSAFDALRRDLKGEIVPALPSLRPVAVGSGNAGFDRPCTARAAKGAINCAA